MFLNFFNKANFLITKHPGTTDNIVQNKKKGTPKNEENKFTNNAIILKIMIVIKNVLR